MCIAIVKPAKVEIATERLEICFHNNPDGAGIAYYDDYGKLKIQKGFFKFNKFLRAYNKVKENRKMLIHFRIKTVGDKNAANCHPFNIGGNSALVHNGTITSIKVEKERSDSSTLSSWLSELNQKHPGFALETATLQILESLIKPSRVAIMTPMRFILLNKEAWKEDEGCFYSNDGFKAKKASYTTPSTTSTGRGIIPWHERKDKTNIETYQYTYNQTYPLDFDKPSKPCDHYNGIQATTQKEPKEVYIFWDKIPEAARGLLLLSRNIDARPHGLRLITVTNDLFDGNRLVGGMSMTEIEAVRDIIINWLHQYRGWPSGIIQRLSTSDLLAIIGMLRMTTNECLEALTNPKQLTSK